MTDTKKLKQAMSLQVTSELNVTIHPDFNHEFLMPTKQVAIGYAVNHSTINRHKLDHKNELIEGKHFISGVSITHSATKGASLCTAWTKRGIVRLGFFIKSERARMFRDWAEDLVINQQKKMSNLQHIQQEYSPLLQLIDKAVKICGSRNELAKRIGVSAAVFSHLVSHPHWVSDNMLLNIERACRNIISNKGKIDTEILEALLRVKEDNTRMLLYNKIKKGGLL